MPNPIAFRPLSVTFWTTVTYLALLIPLVIIHETVPPPDSSAAITEAWSDLDTLTRAYHPYNSRENDVVRDWLLLRLHNVIQENGADESRAVIFDDTVGNVTVRALERAPAALQGPDFKLRTMGTYFEGNNIMVYIRGKDDPNGTWWDEDSTFQTDKIIGKGGVLVNAHFDSVSTAYGATDDGMAVVSVMQLVKHFTSPGNQPQRGIVALLNNNEEDGLWGARVFGNHPLMRFCHVFLNLEGAGAGGKANLFRATDAEVVRAYKGSPNPFGSAVSSDAWKLGAIRSGTDYQIFYDVYGMRGLDVAFYRPRARYHTNQDDARHSSRASLSHMLLNALHTVTSLSGDTGDTFIGDRPDGNRKKVANGGGSDGVWFDLFGQSFAVFDLHSLFAWSLTLLIASPLILIVVTYVLVQKDKYYFFSARKSAYEGSVLDPVMLGGRKGMVRFPFALVVAGSLVIGSAYLVRKFNPFIIYTYEYTTWAMMISLFYFVFWAIMAGANSIRPSALHRGFVILWLFIFTWAFLVVVTVFEDRFRVAAGYAFVFFQGAAFLSALITLVEQFALPTRTAFAQTAHDEHDVRDHDVRDPSSDHFETVPHADNHVTHDGTGDNADEGDEAEAEEPSETTPLVGQSTKKNHTTFGIVYRRSVAAVVQNANSSKEKHGKPFGEEQLWSAKLPSWLWLLQFLILGPFLLVLFGQVGLQLVASVKETGADGGNTLIPYMTAALFSILVMLPVTPFMHRVTHHIPLLLLVVFIATLIYNLVAFPFSASSRYKIYFKQDVNLDTGESLLHYMGVEEYVRQALAELPSAAGKNISCEAKAHDRPDMGYCSYDGSEVLPLIDRNVSEVTKQSLASWISFNSTRLKNSNKARFEIDGKETRACGVQFSEPISSFRVIGGNELDDRFGPAPTGQLDYILLYRRDWTKPFIIDVEWPGIPEKDVEVYCKWNDVQYVPALREALQYTPEWVAITKMEDGLVRGSRTYKV